MLVTLAYCLRDHDITLQLINWMAELGDYKPRHTLLLCHDHRCPKDTVAAILERSKGIFHDVRDLEAKADIDGWPEGANYMFRTVVSYLANKATNVKSFLWLEPDAIPLKIGWLDDIETEYLIAKKPFMGDNVQVEDIPRHMSGVGVYPNPIYNFAGEANRAAGTAWDMAAKDQIVPQAHFTKLIEHAWKHPTFTNLDELKTQIRPEAVLFHASKDGSLIRLLGEQQRSAAHAGQTGLPQGLVHALEGCPGSSNEGENPSPLPNFPVSVQTNETVAGPKGLVPPLTGRGSQAADAASQEARYSQENIGGENLPPKLPGSFQHHDEMYAHSVRGSGPVDAWVNYKSHGTTKQPIYDIFIRTYPVDYPWLQYCIRSIEQFATGFRKVWIISPEHAVMSICPPIAQGKSNMAYEWKTMNEESPDGYLSQQIHKLYADTITNYEADYILHIDSDTLFTRPVSPIDFFGEYGGLTWYYTPYEHTQTPWKVITQKFLGEEPPFEFMRRLPMMIPSWLYPELRTFCFNKHKQNLGDYIRAQPYREFSEFNALGAYAWAKHRDKFHWVNTMEGEMPAPFARQFFSWGGLTDDVKVEIQNILSGNALTPTGISAVGEFSGLSEEDRLPTPDVPTQFNGADDETPGDHVRWLERYIEGSPSRRQYVMAQLKKARLVKLKRGKQKKRDTVSA